MLTNGLETVPVPGGVPWTSTYQVVWAEADTTKDTKARAQRAGRIGPPWERNSLPDNVRTRAGGSTNPGRDPAPAVLDQASLQEKRSPSCSESCAKGSEET